MNGKTNAGAARGGANILGCPNAEGRRLLWILPMLICPAIAVSGRAVDREGLSSSEDLGRGAERIVHHFDFDERPEGNLEDLPKYWEMFRPTGFPHYAQAAFDFDVGNSAAPSFYLKSEGRHVAVQYVGPDTGVRTNSGYRIRAFIKPDRLFRARACLSAHFLGRSGRILTETIVRSQFVGGDGDGPWEAVDIRLPPAPREALAVGLITWVVQEPIWNQAVHPSWHIPRRDVFGGAWFDDITVYRLPRVSLTTSTPTQLLTGEQAQEILVTLADHDDSSLRGSLSILAADGSLVERHAVPVVLKSDPDPLRISVGHLDTGLYQARLEVYARSETLITRTLDFARLAPRLGNPNAIARSWGVAIDPAVRGDPVVETELLRQQRVHSVKLPVWTGRAEVDDSAAHRHRIDRMMQDLVRNNFVLTAVLHGPPGLIVRSSGHYAPSLIELLSTDAGAWGAHLAAVAAPFAGTFRWWQIGSDTDRSIMRDEKIGDVLTHVQTVLSPFITSPQLALPGDTTSTPVPAPVGVGHVTVAFEAHMAPDSFAAVIDGWRASGFTDVSVRVDPLEKSVFDRLGRLEDWSRRVIEARHAGARTVFVPQTWRLRQTGHGSTVEPEETFILLRTIAEIIGDAEPGPVVPVNDAVRCLAFSRGEESVLAMWLAEPIGSSMTFPIQLGGAVRQVDLWGNVTRLERDASGRQWVSVTSSPIIIDGVESWLVQLLSSLRITPGRIDSGEETTRVVLDWTYRGSRDLSGRLKLILPENWEGVPSEFDLRLGANRIERLESELRIPPGETAGTKKLTARLQLSDPPYYLEMQRSVELGLAGIEIWGTAHVEGDSLVLRHTLTNNSSQTVSFRGAAGVPGRERQYRPYTDLKPGDTQTAVYRFMQGSELVGRRVRLSVRELNDGRRTHNLEFLVP